MTVTPAGADGYLAGCVWSENLGWIKMGVGVGPYANTSESDWGVNLDASGNLSGYAWGENVGWIRFNSSLSQVTIDMATGRFAGYAWSENTGWIHFQNSNPAYNVRTTAVLATERKGTVFVLW